VKESIREGEGQEKRGIKKDEDSGKERVQEMRGGFKEVEDSEYKMVQERRGAKREGLIKMGIQERREFDNETGEGQDNIKG
jgi:hypothetical protein